MKMRLLFNCHRYLVTGNFSSAVIWALHFGCKELVPSNWVGGYYPKEKLFKLCRVASLLRALILGVFLVTDRRSVLSSKCSLVFNDHSAKSHECFLVANGQSAASSEQSVHWPLPSCDSEGFSPSRRMYCGVIACSTVRS